MAISELVAGAVVGGVSSLFVGGIFFFARRNAIFRDRTMELATTLAALSSTVHHIDQTVQKMDSKIDALPCHNICPPGGES